MQEITVIEHSAKGDIKKKYQAKQIFSGSYFDTYEHINFKGNKRKHTESKIKCVEVQGNE